MRWSGGIFRHDEVSQKISSLKLTGNSIEIQQNLNHQGNMSGIAGPLTTWGMSYLPPFRL